MPEKEKLRLDKYLWSIRLFKTRSEATDACAKGKVKYNGDAAKASKTVSVGDEYEVKTEAKRWRIKVAALLDHRKTSIQRDLEWIDELIALEERDRTDRPDVLPSPAERSVANLPEGATA